MDLHERVQRLLFSHFPHVPTGGQREACRQLVSFLYDPDPRSAFVLKGYAGTGKTSLVSALIKTLPQLGVKTVLLAPTGRAAKVLSNYSGKKTLTIHKKIYLTESDNTGLMRCVRVRNKHAYTLFIVDEASMIGENAGVMQRSLLDDLLDYVIEGNHCRILLIGDSAQLPPVGSPVSPALDCEYLSSISGLKVFSCELTEVVRQENVSGILKNATIVRRLIDTREQNPEHPVFDLSKNDVCRVDGADLEDLINREYSETGLENVVLVCKTNKRANIFNQEIRWRILYRESELNTGDFLMVVKNNYFWLEEDSPMGFIANGDIVEIQRLRKFEELYGFHFAEATLRFVDYPDNPEVECKILLDTLTSDSPSLTEEESRRLFEEIMLDYADLPNRKDRLKSVKNNPYFNALQVKFSYCLTCHKTQGGQWESVFVDQGYLQDDVVDREYLRWLYTALTRASRKIYLLNFNDDFFSGKSSDCPEL